MVKCSSCGFLAQGVSLAGIPQGFIAIEEEARKTGNSIEQDYPNFSVARWSKGFPYRRAEDLQALMEPLRQAGLAD